MLTIRKNEKRVFDRILVLSFIFMAVVLNFGLETAIASAGVGDKRQAREVIFLDNIVKVSTPGTIGYDRNSLWYRPWADASQVSKLGPHYNPKSRFYSAFWDPIKVSKPGPYYIPHSNVYNCILDPTSVFYNPFMDPTQVSDITSEYYNTQSIFYSPYLDVTKVSDPLSPCYDPESEYYSRLIDTSVDVY